MQRVEISPVLDYYGVQHRPITAWQSVLCPVHEDTRKSARVKIDEDGSGWLQCLGCGFSGNEITLIQTKEGIDAQAALEFAARYAQAGRVHVQGGAAGWRGAREGRGTVPSGEGYRPRFGSVGGARSWRGRS